MHVCCRVQLGRTLLPCAAPACCCYWASLRDCATVALSSTQNSTQQDTSQCTGWPLTDPWHCRIPPAPAWRRAQTRIRPTSCAQHLARQAASRQMLLRTLLPLSYARSVCTGASSSGVFASALMRHLCGTLLCAGSKLDLHLYFAWPAVVCCRHRRCPACKRTRM